MTDHECGRCGVVTSDGYQAPMTWGGVFKGTDRKFLCRPCHKVWLEQQTQLKVAKHAEAQATRMAHCDEVASLKRALRRIGEFDFPPGSNVDDIMAFARRAAAGDFSEE